MSPSSLIHVWANFHSERKNSIITQSSGGFLEPPANILNLSRVFFPGDPKHVQASLTHLTTRHRTGTWRSHCALYPILSGPTREAGRKHTHAHTRTLTFGSRGAGRRVCLQWGLRLSTAHSAARLAARASFLR